MLYTIFTLSFMQHLTFPDWSLINFHHPVFMEQENQASLIVTKNCIQSLYKTQSPVLTSERPKLIRSINEYSHWEQQCITLPNEVALVGTLKSLMNLRTYDFICTKQLNCNKNIIASEHGLDCREVQYSQVNALGISTSYFLYWLL